MHDSRFGTHGGDEPLVCAYSAQPVRGRHAVTYGIGESGYYRILAKFASSVTDADHAAIQAAYYVPSYPAPDADTKEA